jgi:hypothetical protein
MRTQNAEAIMKSLVLVGFLEKLVSEYTTTA